METNRGSFLLGTSALIAAPAIVRITSLMPVKAFAPNEEMEFLTLYREEYVRQFEQSYSLLRPRYGWIPYKIAAEDLVRPAIFEDGRLARPLVEVG